MGPDNAPGEGPADPRPSVEDLLADPAVRMPLKSVLRRWAARDPIDAAEDAALLALALERRADERCARAWSGAPHAPQALEARHGPLD